MWKISPRRWVVYHVWAKSYANHDDHDDRDARCASGASDRDQAFPSDKILLFSWIQKIKQSTSLRTCCKLQRICLKVLFMQIIALE